MKGVGEVELAREERPLDRPLLEPPEERPDLEDRECELEGRDVVGGGVVDCWGGSRRVKRDEDSW